MNTPQLVTRPQAAAEGRAVGWGYLLGQLVLAVPVGSLTAAMATAAAAVEAAGAEADGHLLLDIRADEVRLRLRTLADLSLTTVDLDLARRIGAALATRHTAPPAVAAPRPAQLLEVAVDALDIAGIRPFWQAVLGYDDDPNDDPANGLVDPAGLGPSFWFQQMDAPRLQRNRFHLDLTLTETDAPARIEAALAAGGTLLSDAAARAFWVLADAEGNEVCVCTWQDRD